MQPRTKSVRFTTLVIDDDLEVLNHLTELLRGEKTSLDGREIVPEVDQLLISIDHKDGKYQFSEETLSRVLEISRNEYSYIVIDYSYASKNRQPIQWREGTGASSIVPDTNDHLLTLVDLKEAVETYDRAKGGRRQRRLKKFFGQPTTILLRSFQHDRKRDILGSFDDRLKRTKGIFPNALIEKIDSFQLIYKSEAELRKRFYDAPPNGEGRRFYRNLVLQMTLLHYRAALYKHLGHKARKFLIPRSSAGMALLVVATAAGGSFLQLIAAPLLEAVKKLDIVQTVAFSLVGILTTLVLTGIITYFVETYFRSSVDREE